MIYPGQLSANLQPLVAHRPLALAVALVLVLAFVLALLAGKVAPPTWDRRGRCGTDFAILEMGNEDTEYHDLNGA